MENDKLRAVAEILIESGKEIMKIYRSDDFGMQLKNDQTPVTQADKASSRLINLALKKLFPEVPVLDEEITIPPFSDRGNWEQFFLLDPLDGTKEFLNRNGEFCINLALIENGFPFQGWIFHPVSETGWYTGYGKGIWEFDKSLNFNRISPGEKLKGPLRIVVSRSFFNKEEERLLGLIRDKYDTVIIHLGSSLKHIWLVKGMADMYLKAGTSSEWDTAPGQLMVEEAQGNVLTIPDFNRMGYNKFVLENPGFIMLGKNFNQPEFIDFMKEIIKYPQ